KFQTRTKPDKRKDRLTDLIQCQPASPDFTNFQRYLKGVQGTTSPSIIRKIAANCTGAQCSEKEQFSGIHGKFFRSGAGLPDCQSGQASSNCRHWCTRFRYNVDGELPRAKPDTAR